MVCSQVSKSLEICIDYRYDQKSNTFLGKFKEKFESYLTKAIIRTFKENKDLVSAKKLNILVDINNKYSEFALRNKTKDSFSIHLNPIKLSKEHENIVEYLKLGVPPSKWHVWKKFYGTGSTFTHFIEHEIRHYLDSEEKVLDKVINNYIKKNVGGTWILLLRFINQIRSEAYPKLFDSSGKVNLSGNEMMMIKDNLFKAVKKEELSHEYCQRYNQKPHWREAFFVALESGNHIYSVAKYMSYVIAYSFMPPINVRKAIENNLKLISPSKEAKNKAGNLIRKSTPLEFIELFDKAAIKLKLSEKYKPLSRISILKIRTFIQENEKENVHHLIKMWQHKEITFLDLKKEIKEMMGPA